MREMPHAGGCPPNVFRADHSIWKIGGSFGFSTAIHTNDLKTKIMIKTHYGSARYREIGGYKSYH